MGVLISGDNSCSHCVIVITLSLSLLLCHHVVVIVVIVLLLLLLLLLSLSRSSCPFGAHGDAGWQVQVGHLASPGTPQP